MKVMIENVRLAFPVLFEAKTVNGEGDPAYGASFLIDPESQSELIDKLKAAMKQVATEKWNDKATAILKQMHAGDKLCLHDGDLKSQYDGFEGMLYVSSRSKVRPTVIGVDKSPLTQADGKPYAGCYVNASIELWAQDNNYGKRINAQLRGVQFVKDGDAFAGASAADVDEFDELEPAAKTGTDGDDDFFG